MAPKEMRPWTHLSLDTDLGLGHRSDLGAVGREKGRSKWIWEDPWLVCGRAHEDTERPGERGKWQCAWSAPFQEGNTAENLADLFVSIRAGEKKETKQSDPECHHCQDYAKGQGLGTALEMVSTPTLVQLQWDPPKP